MIKKSIVKITLAVFSLILFSGVTVSAQRTNCSKTTDDDIVKAIYAQMKKTPGLNKQIIHVNIRSNYGVVTLEGWATSRKIRTEIETIARKTKCVKSRQVVNELALNPIGCGPGTKKCGSICIPTEETCNICALRTCT